MIKVIYLFIYLSLFFPKCIDRPHMLHKNLWILLRVIESREWEFRDKFRNLFVCFVGVRVLMGREMGL